MAKITYENFREIESRHVKYVSRWGDFFIIHVLDFKLFREIFVEKYSEAEVQKFFRIFPYTMDTEINDEIIDAAMRLEIEFRSDLQLIELHGNPFVFVDESSEHFEKWEFLGRIQSQPIPLKVFTSIYFEDFVELSTSHLLSSIVTNVRRDNAEQKKQKFIDIGIKDGVYI